MDGLDNFVGTEPDRVGVDACSDARQNLALIGPSRCVRQELLDELLQRLASQRSALRQHVAHPIWDVPDGDINHDCILHAFKVSWKALPRPPLSTARAYPAGVATFVLVHGASLGGWAWRDVRDMLRARGHEVFTPTLTGQGERSHLPVESAQTHVNDVLAILDFEDLHDVHLVLHGYAGILAGPVAQATPRITSITYVASVVVQSGECILDVADPVPGDWGITDPTVAVWVAERVRDLPAACMTSVVRFRPVSVRQSYVRAMQPPADSLSWRRAVEAGWETAEIACGQAPMITAPRQTARLLETLGPRDALPPVFPASPRIALW